MANFKYKTAGQVIDIYEKALREIVEHSEFSYQGEIAQKALDKVYKPKIYKAKVIEEVRERYNPYELYFAEGEIIEVVSGMGRHDQPAWVVVNHIHEDFMFDKGTLEILDNE